MLLETQLAGVAKRTEIDGAESLYKNKDDITITANNPHHSPERVVKLESVPLWDEVR